MADGRLLNPTGIDLLLNYFRNGYTRSIFWIVLLDVAKIAFPVFKELKEHKCTQDVGGIFVKQGSFNLYGQQSYLLDTAKLCTSTWPEVFVMGLDILESGVEVELR